MSNTTNTNSRPLGSDRTTAANSNSNQNTPPTRQMQIQSTPVDSNNTSNNTNTKFSKMDVFRFCLTFELILRLPTLEESEVGADLLESDSLLIHCVHHIVIHSLELCKYWVGILCCLSIDIDCFCLPPQKVLCFRFSREVALCFNENIICTSPVTRTSYESFCQAPRARGF